MSSKNTRKATIEDEEKSIRHFHLKPLECFNHTQLPTNKDVLQRFFWIQDHGSKSQPKKSIALEIYNEIAPKYAMIPCPIKRKETCIAIILKLKSQYDDVIKYVKTHETLSKISIFKQNLENLCDLSALNAPDVIMKDFLRTPSQRIEDCEFLKDQKTERKQRFAPLLVKGTYEKKCAKNIKENTDSYTNQ